MQRPNSSLHGSAGKNSIKDAGASFSRENSIHNDDTSCTKSKSSAMTKGKGVPKLDYETAQELDMLDCSFIISPKRHLSNARKVIQKNTVFKLDYYFRGPI